MCASLQTLLLSFSAPCLHLLIGYLFSENLRCTVFCSGGSIMLWQCYCPAGTGNYIQCKPGREHVRGGKIFITGEGPRPAARATIKLCKDCNSLFSCKYFRTRLKPYIFIRNFHGLSTHAILLSIFMSLVCHPFKKKNNNKRDPQ